MSAVSRINANHVRHAIEERFTQFIDLSDVAGASVAQRSMTLRTRGLAALALTDVVHGLSDETASKHVTDGSKDSGIDALFVDDASKTIFVVQSKWHDEGTGSIGQGDTLKTVNGIKLLTDMQFDKFNAKFDFLWPQVENALTDVDVVIQLVIVVTGSSQLSDDAEGALDGLRSEMNEISELVKVTVMGLRELRRVLTEGSAGARIDLEATLSSWGSLSEPYQAYYGLLDGPTIAEWYSAHGGRLFDQNLRKALGTTAVNSGLVKTLNDEPQNFWYFNNGITALCERVNKTLRGGSNHVNGDFRIEGLSIVNGAQTVSSIAAAHKENPDAVAGVMVWVRLISLEGVPDGFAAEVTRTTNTQNAVEGRDFLSLDPEQERLRMDMLLTMRLSYVFKRGDASPSPEQGCTVQEALIALACANPDTNFAVLAKSNLGRLEDRGGRIYPQLFNSGTTVHQLWQAVQLYRAVEKSLFDLRTHLAGREKAIAQQGNRIVTHVVMQNLGGLTEFGKAHTEEEWANLLEAVPAATEAVLTKLVEAVAQLYSANYVTSLFKNTSRCHHLVASIMGDA
jgi:hypothetical protein